MTLIYLVYIWSAVIALGCTAQLFNDDIFWDKMKRLSFVWSDTKLGTRIMVISSLIPLYNTIYAILLLVLLFVRWLYPKEWEGR